MKRLLCVAAGMLIVAPTFGANVHETLKANPDGSYDTEYPCLAADQSDCRPPGSGVLSWDLVPNQNVVAGTPYSVNFRDHLFGLNALIATISIEECTLPTGWSFAGSTLSYSGTGSGTVTTCHPKAVAATDPPVFANIVSIGATAAGASDTLPPSVPAACSSTGVVNGIDFNCSPSMDNHDGTNNGSGVKEYCWKIDGGADACTNDIGPGIITASTAHTLGSYSPTATSSSSAGVITLTSAGIGADSTADELITRSWSVTGDFTAIAKVSSQTNNGSAFATAGLMARPTGTVANEQYVAVGQWASALSRGVAARGRAIAGALKTSPGSVAGDGTAKYTLMRRAASGSPAEVWTFAWSNDGTTFTTFASSAPGQYILPATLQVGPWLSSFSAGNADTATFTQISITTRAGPTVHLNTVGAASHIAQVRARDLAGTPNTSAYTSVITGTPIVTVSPAKRWHPGIQIELEPWEQRGGAASWTTALFDEFAAMNTPTTKANAIVLKVQWGAIETARGVYDWSKIDAAKAAATARGFKLAILLAHWAQSSGSINYQTTAIGSGGAGRLPAYLATDSEFTALQQDAGTACPAETGSHCTRGGYYVNLGNSVVMPRVWLAPVMDRWIAFMVALGARYDNDPAIEIIRDYTTSILLLPEAWGNDAAFNHGNMTVQLKRQIDAMEAAFPHTNFTIGADYYGSDADMGGILAYMANHHAMISTTDICLKHELNLNGSQGMRIYRGAVGGHDYRTTNGGIPGMSAAFEIEGRTMEIPACVPAGTSMTNILDVIHAKGVAYPNAHQAVAYVGNGEATANKPAWNASVSGVQKIKDFILSGPTVDQTCPRNYDGSCDTH